MRKDGGLLFCSGILTPLQINGSLGYAMVLRDITGRKRAE
jgi:PAS domain S-box-containing protein